MKTKPTKDNYLAAVIIAILFIAGTIYFVWERYSLSDYDAAGAYACMISLLCYLVGLSIKNISFAKKVLIGISLANIFVLLFLIVSCPYSHERINLVCITLFMLAVHIGFYVWIAKKEKRLKKAEEKGQTTQKRR